MSTMTEQVSEPELERPVDGHLYRELDCPVDRLVADEPVPVDVALGELLPGWAR